LRHGFGEREVGDVDRDDVDCFRDECACQSAEVRALEVHHARVAPERTEQLAVADVDRVHATRALPKKDPREAAGRRADVERDAAVNVHAEGSEGCLELATAA